MSFKEPRKGEIAPTIKEVSKYGSTETEISHPAFGQISVSRVSAGGSGYNLYGSDFGHNGFVVIHIKKSRLDRGLSNDHYHPTQEIAHLAMSESQWATFVSSFNSGSGVPCTLTWLAGEGGIPGIPTIERTEMFKKEMKDTTQEALDGIKQLQEAVKNSGLSKKKQDELLIGANKAFMALDSSISFVQEQFEEHIENVVERSKQEIHGYLNAQIHRTGLAAIAQQNEENPILKLD